MNIYKNVLPHGLLKHHLSLMLGNKHESIILSSVFIIWINDNLKVPSLPILQFKENELEQMKC